MQKEIDFLVVGGGVVGSLVLYDLLKKGHSAMMFDSPYPNQASRVAAGLLNPVTGKQYSLTSNATDYFNALNEFYPELERELGVCFFQSLPIYRIFSDVGELNLVSSKFENVEFRSFAELNYEALQGFINPHGQVIVKHGGWVNTNVLLETLHSFFQQKELLLYEAFDYSELNTNDNYYKNWKYKAILFCEGQQGIGNPYFRHLPIVKNKGEILEINCPELAQDKIVIGSVFIVPKGNHLFAVGSTYNVQKTEDGTTENAKSELIRRLEKHLQLPYSITLHTYGIRPTTPNRLPYVASHPDFSNLFMFNGMGSKAVSMMPFLLNQCYEIVKKSGSLR